MSNKGALSGITVLDLSRLLPGPYCSMILADHGARVIAVEDKKFLADGLFLNSVYRNKEHITLNLKTEEGKEIFFRLAKEADVIMEQFRPGVVERLGVDYQSVKKINPGIIYCAITGYGQTGPYKDRAGHDVNYISIAGVLNLIGEPDGQPLIPGVPIADIAGGGMNAAIGILLALQAKQRTGEGQYIDISMTDGMVGFLPLSFFFQQLTGQEFERSNNILSHRYAFYNTYETSDGKYLSIGAVENRFWKILCEKLEMPEYIPLQYDEERRREIIDNVKNIFKKKTLAQWKKELDGLDLCWAPIQNLSEALDDPHLKNREMFVATKDNDGKETISIGVPVKLSETPGSIRTPPVNFGQNTESVLREFGYSKEKIKEFGEMNVI